MNLKNISVFSYGAMIALAGPWLKSAWLNQYSNCLDNSDATTIISSLIKIILNLSYFILN